MCAIVNESLQVNFLYHNLSIYIHVSALNCSVRARLSEDTSRSNVTRMRRRTASRQPHHRLIDGFVLFVSVVVSHATMGYGRQGGEAAAQVRGEGRPAPSPSSQELADPITAVGRRLALSEAEISSLRATAAAVSLIPGENRTSAQNDDAAAALLLLVDQALAAPDYATLGKGWFYPDSRIEYRRRSHDVFTCAASRARQRASAARLAERLRAVAAVEPSQNAAADLAALICEAFVDEIGAGHGAASPVAEWKPHLPAVRAALEAGGPFTTGPFHYSPTFASSLDSVDSPRQRTHWYTSTA